MRWLDKDEVIDVLLNVGFSHGETDYENGIAKGFLLAKEEIENMPSWNIDIILQGKWDAIDEDIFYYRCSRCGFNAYGNTVEVMDGTFRYCPHCGARMEGVDE